MRPDRLVVGEVREAESLDLLIALNSGLPGMCTIHANSARDALVKLCTLPLLAGRNIDSAFVVPTVASCIDLVVHLGDRSRRRAPRRRDRGADRRDRTDAVGRRRDDLRDASGARSSRPAHALRDSRSSTPHGLDPEHRARRGGPMSLVLGAPARARPAARRVRRSCGRHARRSRATLDTAPMRIRDELALAGLGERARLPVIVAVCARARDRRRRRSRRPSSQVPVLTIVAAVLGRRRRPARSFTRARDPPSRGEPRRLARRRRPPRRIGSRGDVAARERRRAGGARPRLDAKRLRRVRRATTAAPATSQRASID